VSGSWSAKDLRRQPEAQGTRDRRSERLSLLLQVLHLLRDRLNQLLKLLQLRRDELEQVLEVHELVLLEYLQLLKLLRDDLQQLPNLLHRLLPAERLSAEGRHGRPLSVRLLRIRLNAKSLAGIRRKADSGIGGLRSDSKRASCERTHQSSLYRMWFPPCFSERPNGMVGSRALGRSAFGELKNGFGVERVCLP
jgi:hypothetical protein